MKENGAPSDTKIKKTQPAPKPTVWESFAWEVGMKWREWGGG